MNTKLLKENLIKLLGIEKLPDKDKVKIVDQAGELVEKRLLNRVLDNLEEQKREAFLKILTDKNEEEITKFLTTEVPEFGIWMKEEVIRVKADLASLAKA
jgi:Mg/Co/Ni transporter MgtE